MNVIFLDIDGVLATSESYQNHVPPFVPATHKWKGGFPGLDPDCCSRLDKLCKEFNASIVISSTWRHGEPEDFEQLKQYLAYCGISAPIIDRTPTHRKFSAHRGSHYQRGNEIREWLDDHPEVKNFVVFDDDDDMDAVKDNFICVYNGFFNKCALNSSHIIRARDILKGQKK